MYKHRSCATQFWQNEAKRRGTIALRERLARVRQGQGLRGAPQGAAPFRRSWRPPL